MNPVNLDRRLATLVLLLAFGLLLADAHPTRPARPNGAGSTGRERLSLNEGWKFARFTSNPDSLSYSTLKPWILPSGNDFIQGTKHQPPSGSAPGGNVTYVQSSFDDSSWEAVDLPHDWAIKGPFNAPGISGGEGRLPVNGVGWYRRKVTLAKEDEGKSIFLDIDGAMSYSAVWLNSQLVGGWPYGYASFRLDLTPLLKLGDDNLLAVRLDNAVDNSRWYPGAGIYRNVWIVKTDPTHVDQYGTQITTSDVSGDSAIVNLAVQVENRGQTSRDVDVATEIRVLDSTTGQPGTDVVASFKTAAITVPAGGKQSLNSSVTVTKPLLWGPAPGQTPNLYIALTTLSVNGTVIDTYETPFGIRSITYDADKGILVNGQAVQIQGTCNHHDHGSLGAAFNIHAATRQLSLLQEMGSNALRTSHNPPAPELLDLADRLGFLVLDEIFDTWNSHKTTNDFETIFADWHEPDLRNFIRRDRNHPSILAWSIGNEIGEQATAQGGTTGSALRTIVRQEDGPSPRPVTAALNFASPNTALPNALDLIGLNYQGEGEGTSTAGSFAAFHSAYPQKVIWSSESASALSTRGTYIFPVTASNSATVSDTPPGGGNSTALEVSAYELYATSWGSSPDKVFAAHDSHPFVAGEFVWTGWDYLGEPTPYGGGTGTGGGARSSYFGIIDLAGFKKDRFYLYQARWAPSVRMAHVLPHWSWGEEREGQVTPVHVFSAADEAELFVNGVSAGRVKRGAGEYRFRWDSVVYQPGNVSVVTWKEGEEWARETRRTVGAAEGLSLAVDRASVAADGYDVAFVTLAVVDGEGQTVPDAENAITFSVSGPGSIVSTDNGNPADYTAFPSLTRKAFSGLALAVVRANKGASGNITITAKAEGLSEGHIDIQTA